MGEIAPADDSNLGALDDGGNRTLVVIALAMVPADLPDGVVRVDEVDTHVDGAVASSETGGCDGGAQRSLVKDGVDFRVPALVRIISSLHNVEVVILEPEPVCRVISGCLMD